MSTSEVLEMVKSGKITVEQAGAMLPKGNGSASNGRLSCKVSEKGGMSVYGLQRMPVTLYAGQWERLLDAEFVAFAKAFLKDHASELATKAAKVA